MDLLNIFEVFARLRQSKKQMKMKYKHSDSKNLFEINLQEVFDHFNTKSKLRATSFTGVVGWCDGHG